MSAADRAHTDGADEQPADDAEHRGQGQGQQSDGEGELPAPASESKAAVTRPSAAVWQQFSRLVFSAACPGR